MKMPIGISSSGVSFLAKNTLKIFCGVVIPDIKQDYLIVNIFLIQVLVKEGFMLFPIGVTTKVYFPFSTGAEISVSELLR